MQQTIRTAAFENIVTSQTYVEKAQQVNSFSKFLTWCDRQEKNRFLWLGIALMGHIGMLLPLTLFAILFLADNNFALWIAVLCANLPVLALNLAAQSPKVTIPVMVTSLIINTVIVIISAVMFLV